MNSDVTADVATDEYVCELSELPIGRAVQAQVGDHIVAVVRLAEREVHAVDDLCTHGRVSLAEGDVVGCEIECWLHGSRFNLITGAVSGPPALIPVAVYAVRLDGDAVYISTTPNSTQENPS